MNPLGTVENAAKGAYGYLSSGDLGDRAVNVATLGYASNPKAGNAYLLSVLRSMDPRTRAGLVNLALTLGGTALGSGRLGGKYVNPGGMSNKEIALYLEKGAQAQEQAGTAPWLYPPVRPGVPRLPRGAPYQQDPMGAYIPGESPGKLTAGQRHLLLQLKTPRSVPNAAQRSEILNKTTPAEVFQKDPSTAKAVARLGYSTGLPEDDLWSVAQQTHPYAGIEKTYSPESTRSYDNPRSVDIHGAMLTPGYGPNFLVGDIDRTEMLKSMIAKLLQTPN